MSAAWLEPPALAARIPDGTRLAIAPDHSGPATRIALELARREARALRLVAVPQAGLVADLLIGAGCVATIEAAAVSLGEHGRAPRFTEALAAGRLRVLDSTCPAIHAGLQAAEKGLPFMPSRGILGSDLLRVRPEWKVIENPYPPGDPLVLVPAIRPQVSLIHVPLADRQGNLWVGRHRELMLMAHAAERCLASTEALHPGDLLADPQLAPGTLPALYVEAVALAPGGALPLGLFTRYPPARADIAAYARAAHSAEDFAHWLAQRLASLDGSP